MIKNKFEIGDLVKFKQDKDSDAGEVLSLSFDGKKFTYRISSKEVDLEKKEIEKRRLNKVKNIKNQIKEI